MTEYRIIKNRKEIKRIKCSEEFAASIALQANGEYEKITHDRPVVQAEPRKTRQEKIIEKLTKENKL